MAEGGGSGSSQGTEVKDILGRLPRTIGTGEHEKPILEGMAMALQDLVLEVQDLKGAVYRSWRLEPDCPYITQGMKFKELYNKKCREVRGKGQDLGHQRNWVFLGLLTGFRMVSKLLPKAYFNIIYIYMYSYIYLAIFHSFIYIYIVVF